MNDAAAIISTCSRLLSSPRTLTETEARAAAAACKAWLEQNHYDHHIQSQQHAAVVSRHVRPRLPSEVLDAILRQIPYFEKALLLACSLVNKEWRGKAWTHLWKRSIADATRTPLAVTARRFLLPWALEAMKGTQVRDLFLWVNYSAERLDDLPLLLAPPTFRGIRYLRLANRCSTLHLLMAFRSLSNLICLQCYGSVRDERVAWGQHLQLGEKEENEIWRMGLGNLKALQIGLRKSESSGIMLQKLTMALGPKLESLQLGLENAEAEYYEQDLAELLRNLPEKCPYLVEFSLMADNMKATNSLHRFIKTQQQLVYLTLEINVSDELIRNIAASCFNLKLFSFRAGDNVTTRCFQHLATGPFLRILNVERHRQTLLPDNNAIAKKDIIEYLRQRGKELIYLQFPNDEDCSFAPLLEFCPNIRHLGPSLPCSYSNQDVIAFLKGAEKLENVWIDNQSIMAEKEIRDVASARKVQIYWISPPSYVHSKRESWVGL